MKTVLGDMVKSKSTGEFYKVKKIKEPMFLLEAENVPNKLWLGNKDSLELLYEEVNHLKEPNLNSAAWEPQTPKDSPICVSALSF